MARGNFPAVMEEVFRHEGGFVNHPRDPGGATNFGITHGTLARWRGQKVTVQDVRELTKAEAREIYRVDYWQPVRGDELPDGIDLVTMDPAVNSGVGRGAQWMQRALGVTADGRVGPITLAAAAKADPVATIQKACAIRMGFLQGLRTWSTFGRGWSRRVASVEAVGVRMAQEARKAPPVPFLVEGKDKAEAAAQRDKAGAGASIAGGGGGATLADLPGWGIAGLILAAVVIAVMFMGHRRHQLDRVEAYRKEVERMKP